MPKLSSKLSPYKRYIKKWSDCTNCSLCETRNKVVLIKGTSIPCDILFVGEAPGASEDVLGKPFAGPAGSLLQEIMHNAGALKVSYAMTNTIACIPLAEGRELSVPPKFAVAACRSRLEECISLCKPEVIIWVGAFAEVTGNKLKAVKDIPTVSIIHPAAILRMHVSQRMLAIKRCVVTIADAIDAYVAPF